MRTLLISFLLCLSLLIVNISCQPDLPDLPSLSDDDISEFYIDGTGNYGYFSNPNFMYSSGFEGSKKSALPSVTLPMLLTEAPVQTKKTQELPAELHTTKTMQPVIQKRTMIQPIIQQRIVTQPILRTHLLIQPVHKWIDTLPVVQPKIIQKTQLIRQYQEQPIIVPKLIEKTQVQQTFEAKPRTLPVQTNKPQYEAQPIQTAKTRLPARQAINTAAGLMQGLGLNPNVNVVAAAAADPIDPPAETENLTSEETLPTVTQ